MEKIKVAVLFGGQSSEHEVSRVSAQSVIENLDSEKYEVIMIGITKKGEWLRYFGDVKAIGSGQWQELAVTNHSNDTVQTAPTYGPGETLGSFLKNLTGNQTIDVVFPVLHGSNGEDGTLQGFLEMAGIPYAGCNVVASAVGMDKALSKAVFEHAGLDQCRYIVVKRTELEKNLMDILKKVDVEIGYPCFVKPSNAGSSVGISKVKEPGQLFQALLKAGIYDRKILIEECIDGREVECAVLGNDAPIASTVGEIVPCNEFYDYNAKYVNGDSKTIVPAALNDEMIDKIRACAITAFTALDCSGLSRVDFFVENKTNRVIINEINTMPGFTSISMYPKLWMASGIPYRDLLDKLIELAFQRYNEKQKSYERTT